MSTCCEAKSCEIEQMRESHSKTLKIVLIVNLLMFLVEFTFGVISRSTALLGDSLDMLGDATVYAMSLYVVASTIRVKSKVAVIKGCLMVFLGLMVLVEAARKALGDILPVAQTMGVIGFLALAANAYCLWLLTRHRDDDLNMRSVWLCSRNDIVANVSVLIAAGMVSTFSSKWPDVIVGSGIALLFLQSGAGIVWEAVESLRAPTIEPEGERI